MANSLVPQGGSALALSSSDRWGEEPLLPSEQLSLREFVRILDRYKFMILMIVGLTAIAVLIQQLASPNMYRSTAHVQVELIDEVGTNQADVNSRNQQRVANSVRVHRSRSSAEQVVKDLDLTHDPAFLKEAGKSSLEGEVGQQIATNTLLGMVEISAQDGSDLLEIAVESRSPELAARIANQYPLSVRTVRNAMSNDRRNRLLDSLLQEQRQRSELAESTAQAVADFRSQHQMLQGAGSVEDLAQINRIGAEAASAAAMRAGSAAQSSGVSRAAGMSSSAMASTAALDQLERQRAQLVAERSRLASTYGPNHPDMVRVESELSSVLQNIDDERRYAQSAATAVANAEGSRMAELARSEAAREAARASTLAGMVSNLENRAYQNVANTVELDRLTREADLADQAYKDIAARVELIKAQMQMEGVSSSIVSPAVPDYNRISPAPAKMTAIALIGSGVLAILLAFCRELVNDRLRTAAQIRRHFGLPTFGMLPFLGGGVPDDPQDSPVIKNPQSLFAEVARSTLAEVRSVKKPDSGSQTVLLTSPLPGDGKSTVSLTLAAAGAAEGLRTVVLDLDLRKRGLLQRVQEGMDTPDLVDIITGRADLSNVIGPAIEDELLLENLAGRTEVSERPRIVLLSAHEPVEEPAALIGNMRLRNLLADLQSKFDLVIINAPATLAVRDARAMCEYADHTVMIARWGYTTIDQMKAALELLRKNVTGVVFDQVDYAEHARRRYGDSVQFYVESARYYSSDVPVRTMFWERVRQFFGRSAEAS